MIYDPLEKDIRKKDKYEKLISVLKAKIETNSSLALELEKFYSPVRLNK